MKQEYKDRWIEALESGKYRQGKHALQTRDGGFCCLGVLCDIVKDEVGASWQTTQNHDISFALPFIVDQNYLPVAVQNLVGLTSKNPILKLTDGEHSLDVCNDTLDMNFSQIATLIREQL